MNPAKLSKAEVDSILSAFKMKDTSSERVCKFLIKSSNVTSSELRAWSGALNISDLANRIINPKIESLGFFIACQSMAIPPKFRGSSNEVRLWSIFRESDFELEQLNKGETK